MTSVVILDKRIQIYLRRKWMYGGVRERGRTRAALWWGPPPSLLEMRSAVLLKSPSRASLGRKSWSLLSISFQDKAYGKGMRWNQKTIPWFPGARFIPLLSSHKFSGELNILRSFECNCVNFSSLLLLIARWTLSRRRRFGFVNARMVVIAVSLLFKRLWEQVYDVRWTKCSFCYCSWPCGSSWLG